MQEPNVTEPEPKKFLFVLTPYFYWIRNHWNQTYLLEVALADLNLQYDKFVEQHVALLLEYL